MSEQQAQAEDPNLAKPNIWEVVKTKEGAFDILHKGKLLRAEIPDKWLEDELGKYGFCGEEYRDIRRQLEESDKAQIVFRAETDIREP